MPSSSMTKNPAKEAWTAEKVDKVESKKDQIIPPRSGSKVVYEDPCVQLHGLLPGQDGLVKAGVVVTEDAGPSSNAYQLTFQVKLADGATAGRSIGYKELLLMVSSWSYGDLPKEYRLTGRSPKGRTIDKVMRKWVISGIPPDRQTLVHWLLWRIEVGPSFNDGKGPRLTFVGADQWGRKIVREVLSAAASASVAAKEGPSSSRRYIAAEQEEDKYEEEEEEEEGDSHFPPPPSYLDVTREDQDERKAKNKDQQRLSLHRKGAYSEGSMPSDAPPSYRQEEEVDDESPPPSYRSTLHRKGTYNEGSIPFQPPPSYHEGDVPASHRPTLHHKGTYSERSIPSQPPPSYHEDDDETQSASAATSTTTTTDQMGPPPLYEGDEEEEDDQHLSLYSSSASESALSSSSSSSVVHHHDHHHHHQPQVKRRLHHQHQHHQHHQQEERRISRQQHQQHHHGEGEDEVEEENYKEFDMDLLVSRPRPYAVKVEDQSSWGPYSRRLSVELRKSKRDLEGMRETRRRQQAVRHARQMDLLGKMNVLRKKQKMELIERRTSNHMARDVIDLHEMMATMERETKRVACQIMKDRERIYSFKQPYAQRRGGWQKGPNLGLGPLPYQATCRPSNNPEARAAKAFKWDDQGRRHKKGPRPPAANVYEAAMQVILDLATSGFERHLCLHRAFRYFDQDGNGKISKSEFATAIQMLKPKPTAEQLLALFGYFDPNETGAISYGEFLTQFFDRRKLVNSAKRNEAQQRLQQQNEEKEEDEEENDRYSREVHNRGGEGERSKKKHYYRQHQEGEEGEEEDRYTREVDNRGGRRNNQERRKEEKKQASKGMTRRPASAPSVRWTSDNKEKGEVINNNSNQQQQYNKKRHQAVLQQQPSASARQSRSLIHQSTSKETGITRPPSSATSSRRPPTVSRSPSPSTRAARAEVPSSDDSSESNEYRQKVIRLTAYIEGKSHELNDLLIQAGIYQSPPTTAASSPIDTSHRQKTDPGHPSSPYHHSSPSKEEDAEDTHLSPMRPTSSAVPRLAEEGGEGHQSSGTKSKKADMSKASASMSPRLVSARSPRGTPHSAWI